MDINNIFYQLIALATPGDIEYLYNHSQRRTTHQVILRFSLDQLPDLVGIFYNYSIDIEPEHTLFFDGLPLNRFVCHVEQFNTDSSMSTKILDLEDTTSFLLNLMGILHIGNPDSYNDIDDFNDELLVSNRQGTFNFGHADDISDGYISITIFLPPGPRNIDMGKLLTQHRHGRRLKNLDFNDLLIEALDLRLSNNSTYSNILRNTYRDLRHRYTNDKKGKGINNNSNEENFINFSSRFLNNSFTINRLTNIKNLNISTRIASLINNLDKNGP